MLETEQVRPHLGDNVLVTLADILSVYMWSLAADCEPVGAQVASVLPGQLKD